MAKKKREALPILPLHERWNGETGFRLGDINEADMQLIAGGTVPDWLKRTARSLLIAQKKYTIRFEEQEPGIHEELAS